MQVQPVIGDEMRGNGCRGFMPAAGDVEKRLSPLHHFLFGLIDAPRSGLNVEKIPLSTPWYADNLDGVLRP